MLHVIIDSHYTRVFTNSYHTMQKPMRDKIHHLWITSKDHFTKQICLFSNQNPFGSYTSLIICIQTHLYFVGNEFSGSHCRLRTPFDTFWTFTVGVSKPFRVFHPRENLALLAITRHKFSLPFHATVRLCWTSSNGTKPTQSITKHSVDFQPCTHTHSMRCPYAYAM